MSVRRVQLISAATWAFVAVALALLTPNAEAARTGGLDRHFGDRGRLQTAAGLSASRLGIPPAHTAVAADGAILVASQGLPVAQALPPLPPGANYVQQVTPLDYPIQLRRFQPDGRPDPSFGQGGVIDSIPRAPGLGFSLTDLLIDSAGRPILVGTSYGPGLIEGVAYSPGIMHSSYATVMRLEPDGGRDLSFGQGGVALFDLGLRFSRYELPAAGVAAGHLDDQDRVVLLVSQQYIGGQVRATILTKSSLVARVTGDGALDGEFAAGGVRALGEFAATAGLAVGPNGSIALAGAVSDRTGNPRTEVLKLTPAGSINRRFGNRGTRTVNVSGHGIDFDRRGRVLLRASSPAGWRVVRLAKRGRLDRSFGAHGIVLIGPALFDRAELNDIAADSRGGVLLAGGNHGRLVIARRLPSGRPDLAFGRRGHLVTGFGTSSNATATEVELYPDRRILVGGLVTRTQPPDGSPAYARHFLTRYLTR